jgi:hypothetical protein
MWASSPDAACMVRPQWKKALTVVNPREEYGHLPGALKRPPNDATAARRVPFGHRLSIFETRACFCGGIFHRIESKTTLIDDSVYRIFHPFAHLESHNSAPNPSAPRKHKLLSVGFAGYWFGNFPWVQTNLSEIVWALIIIPGVIAILGTWHGIHKKKTRPLPHRTTQFAPERSPCWRY